MIPVPAAVGAAAIVLGAVVVAGHSEAPASVGAGTQPGPVSVTLAPGAIQRARVQVRDTGSAAETLTIVGSQERSGQIIPISWVRRVSVTTAPGIWRTVTFTVAVPASTAPGQYRLLVGAGAAPAGNPGGAAFGATEFTDLVVTVTTSASPRHDTPRNAHTTSMATGA